MECGDGKTEAQWSFICFSCRTSYLKPKTLPVFLWFSALPIRHFAFSRGERPVWPHLTDKRIDFSAQTVGTYSDIYEHFEDTHNTNLLCFTGTRIYLIRFSNSILAANPQSLIATAIVSTDSILTSCLILLMLELNYMVWLHSLGTWPQIEFTTS